MREKGIDRFNSKRLLKMYWVDWEGTFLTKVKGTKKRMSMIHTININSFIFLVKED